MKRLLLSALLIGALLYLALLNFLFSSGDNGPSMALGTFSALLMVGIPIFSAFALPLIKSSRWLSFLVSALVLQFAAIAFPLWFLGFVSAGLLFFCQRLKSSSRMGMSIQESSAQAYTVQSVSLSALVGLGIAVAVIVFDYEFLGGVRESIQAGLRWQWLVTLAPSSAIAAAIFFRDFRGERWKLAAIGIALGCAWTVHSVYLESLLSGPPLGLVQLSSPIPLSNFLENAELRIMNHLSLRPASYAIDIAQLLAPIICALCAVSFMTRRVASKQSASWITAR